MPSADKLYPDPGLLALAKCPDEELVRLLVAGNHEAMNVIFDRYYSLLMRVALRVVRDHGEAEDVVSITFSDFYRKAELFNPEKGNLRTWLLQYIYGRSINRLHRLKSRSHFNQVDLADVDPQQLAAKTGSSCRLDEPEEKLLIQQLLRSLSEKHRRVIELICFEGLTIAEAASITGDSAGNVQHSYYRSLEKLRVKFHESQARGRTLFGTAQDGQDSRAIAGEVRNAKA